MDNMTIKRDTIASTRVNHRIKEEAVKNLNRRGIKLSEYLRFAIGQAANDDLGAISFLNTPEALNAKKEVEQGHTKKIGSLQDMDKWMDNL